MNLLRSYEKRVMKWRAKLYDPDALTLDEQKLAEMTRRDKSATVQLDRLREFAEFHRMSEAEAAEVQSIKNKAVLEAIFDNVETDDGLLKNYRDASFYYTARMQLAYTRFPVAFKLLRYFNALYPKNKRADVRVLDYGSGVGDYGMAFAVHGYHVTLLDIEGGNLDFARWRFEQRGLKHDVIPVTDASLYPPLGRQDIILSGEVMEHVRDPLTVLKNSHAALPKGGFLWYSGYPDHEREVGGDHLQEAADVRPQALAFVQQHFKPATRLQLPGSLYKKM
ncbi:MAG: class I SAM-dependent methyltransferase [Candidatus Melainabacteria bacterium]